ncbi:hypothetical protein L9F63_026546, partial [Diploptera punctata]
STTDEIIDILEQDVTIMDGTLYIRPPELHEMSESDTGDEDCQVATINNLSGNLLRAQAELQVRRLTEGGVEDETLGLPEGQESNT